jgi:hypothetical protein
MKSIKVMAVVLMGGMAHQQLHAEKYSVTIINKTNAIVTIQAQDPQFQPLYKIPGKTKQNLKLYRHHGDQTVLVSITMNGKTIRSFIYLNTYQIKKDSNGYPKLYDNQGRIYQSPFRGSLHDIEPRHGL